jgi:hypothetical protein
MKYLSLFICAAVLCAQAHAKRFELLRLRSFASRAMHVVEEALLEELEGMVVLAPAPVEILLLVEEEALELGDQPKVLSLASSFIDATRKSFVEELERIVDAIPEKDPRGDWSFALWLDFFLTVLQLPMIFVWGVLLGIRGPIGVWHDYRQICLDCIKGVRAMVARILLGMRGGIGLCRDYRKIFLDRIQEGVRTVVARVEETKNDPLERVFNHQWVDGLSQMVLEGAQVTPRDMEPSGDMPSAVIETLRILTGGGGIPQQTGYAEALRTVTSGGGIPEQTEYGERAYYFNRKDKKTDPRITVRLFSPKESGEIGDEALSSWSSEMIRDRPKGASHADPDPSNLPRNPSLGDESVDTTLLDWGPSAVGASTRRDTSHSIWGRW